MFLVYCKDGEIVQLKMHDSSNVPAKQRPPNTKQSKEGHRKTMVKKLAHRTNARATTNFVVATFKHVQQIA